MLIDGRLAATYPLDLVRARLSIATANLATNSASKRAFSVEAAKLGIMGMTKKVYRTEGGVRGLYRGCWATAVGVAPYGGWRLIVLYSSLTATVSLNFYLYESCMLS